MSSTGATETPVVPPGSYELEVVRPCPACGNQAPGKAWLDDIPHFRDVAVLDLDCGQCGTKSLQHKTGNNPEPQGQRYTLQVTSEADLTRKVLKSKFATIRIPDIGLEISHETFPDKYTDIDTMLRLIFRDLSKSAAGMEAGAQKEAMAAFLRQLMQLIQGRLETCIILDDPAGLSYMQSFSAPEQDACIQIESYDRTAEVNTQFAF
ncbi:nucleolar zinc-finger protein [Sorochytrium milnesiophthora]